MSLPYQVVALQTVIPQIKNELAVSKGDVLKVLHILSDDPDWLIVQDGLGNVGMIMKAMTELAHSLDLPSSPRNGFKNGSSLSNPNSSQHYYVRAITNFETFNTNNHQEKIYIQQGDILSACDINDDDFWLLAKIKDTDFFIPRTCVEEYEIENGAKSSTNSSFFHSTSNDIDFLEELPEIWQSKANNDVSEHWPKCSEDNVIFDQFDPFSNCPIPTTAAPVNLRHPSKSSDTTSSHLTDELHNQNILSKARVNNPNILLVPKDKGEHHFNSRNKIIQELISSEKDYLNTLIEICSVFSQESNASHQMQEVNVNLSKVVRYFNNIISASSSLLGVLQAQVVLPFSEQYLGRSFVEHHGELQHSYSSFLTEYERICQYFLTLSKESSTSSNFLDECILRLQKRVSSCFSMESVLIRPLQRILKYPLFLKDLYKNTPLKHPDISYIKEAITLMMKFAVQLNEDKRRFQLIQKYSNERANDQHQLNLSSLITRLNLHTLKKKSSRFSIRFSNSIFGSEFDDGDFENLSRKFNLIEKSCNSFQSLVVSYLNKCSCISACLLDADRSLRSLSTRNAPSSISSSRNRNPFLNVNVQVQKEVLEPIKALSKLLQNPAKFIKKREDKLLDYLILKKAVKANKIHESSYAYTCAKNCFTTLNHQLMQDIPQLLSSSTLVFRHSLHKFSLLLFQCTSSFLPSLHCNSLSNSKIAICASFKHKKLIQSFDERYQHDLLPLMDSFLLILKPFCPTKSYSSTLSLPSYNITDKKDIFNIRPEALPVLKESHFYKATISCFSNHPLSLNINAGDIVKVIKFKDPSGNSNHWLVKHDKQIGFVPSLILSRLTEEENPWQSSNSHVSLQKGEEKKPGVSTPELLLDFNDDSEVFKTRQSSVEAQTHVISVSKNDDFFKKQTTSLNNLTSQLYEELDFNFKVAKVLYNFSPSGEYEIDVNAGEDVKVIERSDESGNDDWFFGASFK